MKKIFTSILSVVIAGIGFSQSQRMVLIEEASNASCGPCAAQNPAFHTLLEANASKTVVLKYQWYFPGYDPMNEHNPSEVATRFESYYGQNGVPTAMIDGDVPDTATAGFNHQEWYFGAPGGFSSTMIDNRYAVPAPFDIDVDYVLTPDNISVTATANCTQDVSGNLKLRIAVIERVIQFDSAPGSNGETVFYNVMKKFLPNPGGVAMAGTYASGESFTTTQNWNLANIYDYSQVAVVVFIQNDLTKEVLQAKLAEGVALAPASAVDAATLSTSGIVQYSCENTINPSVTIRNHGADVLTSLDINYDLNGTTGSIPWTGSLDFFETAVVSLGAITYPAEATNVLEVTTSNPNGAADMNASNNDVSAEVYLAAYAALTIKVKVYTDYYPGETTWEIRNSDNDVVATHTYQAGPGEVGAGGPDANKEHVHNVTLEASDCYSFKLKDSYGDGMLYSGTGGGITTYGYKIANYPGVVIAELMGSSLNFGTETANSLKTDEASSINDASLESSVSIYPNPSNAQTSIRVSSDVPASASVQIFNALGQKIDFRLLGKVSGEQSFAMDVNHLPSGLYFFAVTVGEKTTTKKMTIAH